MSDEEVYETRNKGEGIKTGIRERGNRRKTGGKEMTRGKSKKRWSRTETKKRRGNTEGLRRKRSEIGREGRWRGRDTERQGRRRLGYEEKGRKIAGWKDDRGEIKD